MKFAALSKACFLAVKSAGIVVVAYLLHDILVQLNLRIAPEVPWSILVAVLVAVVFSTTIGESWSAYPVARFRRLRSLELVYIGASVGLCLAVLVFQGSLGHLKVASAEVPEQAGRLLGFGIHWLLPNIVAIYEEIAFRGILQGSLKSIIGTRSSILVAGTVYCAIHAFNPGFDQYWAVLLVLGLTAGISCARTGMLMPAVAIHLLYNVLVSLITQWKGGIDLSLTPPAVMVASGCAAAVFIWLLGYAERRVTHAGPA